MEHIDSILARFPKYQRDNLIPILQQIQEEMGYISEEAMIKTGKHLLLPSTKIYGVASFYDHFRFNPKGKYHITICKGTSCHLNEGEILHAEAEKLIKIQSGQVSKDGLFSLEYSACMGACGTGPILTINGKYYTKMNLTALRQLIDELKNS